MSDAKKEKVEEKKNGELAVSVKEPARQNLANRRVKQLLADYFNISIKNVRLINGHHHPKKLFSIDVD